MVNRAIELPGFQLDESIQLSGSCMIFMVMVMVMVMMMMMMMMMNR